MRGVQNVLAEPREGDKAWFQIRVTLETQNPLASAALAILDVTRKQHFLNHAERRNPWFADEVPPEPRWRVQAALTPERKTAL